MLGTDMDRYAGSSSQGLILVADDDRITRYMMRTALSKIGYRIKAVETGADCLRAYQQEVPDLVLLDARMPDMDGFECCRQLKKLPQGQQVAVLMITGLADACSIEQAFTAGASDYMTKPIQWSELKQRIQTFIRPTQRQWQLEAVQ